MENRQIIANIHTDEYGKCYPCDFWVAGQSCFFNRNNDDLTPGDACRAAEIKVNGDVRIIAENAIEHYEGPEDFPSRLLPIIKDYLKIARAAGKVK
jgi:hypothetical protein